MRGAQGRSDGLALLPHPGELLAALFPMLLLVGVVVFVVVRFLWLLAQSGAVVAGG